MTKRILSRIFVQDENRPIDRRKKIDPRFRDRNNPDFVNRRVNPLIDRRQTPKARYQNLSELGFVDRRTNPYGPKPPAGDKSRSFHLEYPERKKMMTIGIVTGLLLIFLFTMSFFITCKMTPDSIHKIKKSISPIIGF